MRHPAVPLLSSRGLLKFVTLCVQGGRVANGTASELQSVEVCTSLPTGPVNELEGPAPVNWFSTADMTVPRTCLAAAAVGSSLYAIGGQAGRQTWRTVEAYDAQQDRWLQLSGSMHSERKYTSAAALHGKLRDTTPAISRPAVVLPVAQQSDCAAKICSCEGQVAMGHTL